MGKQVGARIPWGCSSVGRAPALQAGGQGFESPHLHENSKESSLDSYLGSQRGKHACRNECIDNWQRMFEEHP